MSTWIALLRGINVGGKNLVPMAELRDVFSQAGFPRAKTLLQSGNVAFAAEGADAESLAARLEQVTEERFGRTIPYVIRRLEYLEKLIDACPLPREAQIDPGRLLVHFGRQPFETDAVSHFAESYTGPERILPVLDEIAVYYPDGIGNSKLKMPFYGTARNWNTVLKLCALGKSI